MSPSVAQPHFLQGGGNVGALLRTHDWAASPLGLPGTWPHPLRTAVDLVLQSRFPMFVAWGDELGFLYNDAYAEILGAKHPRALGRRFQEIWEEIWGDISPLIDSAMAGHATYREDLPLVMNRHGYDEQTWFTFSYSPLRDDTGKVAGMFCAVNETTRRVLAERHLRDLNETLEGRVHAALAERKLLADVVEGTGALVQVADLDFRWLAINKASADEFERIFGVRPNVGDSMLELLASQPQHQADVQAVWARALAGEEFVETGEFGDPTRDRRIYEMRYNTLRDREGRRIGAYQLVFDVTERAKEQERLRQAEDFLRQSQKMESLGQLTGGVAHDFNNLLAVFSNGLHLLERDASDDQKQRVYASMRRAVARGSGLTRHLLSFSRRKAINPEAVDLASCLEGMRDLLGRSLRGDIQVRMELAADLWAVEIDAGEFEIAMLNLCVNARDAMPAGGTITITARNVVDTAEGGGMADYVRLAVQDAGCGMPPEVLSRVFEPFFTTKDVGKGSGLGLPQVYGFAQQSGGRLSLDSQVGAGTTVTLLLPRCLHQPTVASHVPRAVAPSVRRSNLLLVEDDTELAALTREMLATLGFDVIHAASATAALGALANNRSVDVVLSDVLMPGSMNGVQLAREIRSRHPALRVVLTSGYSQAIREIDGDEFRLLPKPYTLEGLCSALGMEQA